MQLIYFLSDDQCGDDRTEGDSVRDLVQPVEEIVGLLQLDVEREVSVCRLADDVASTPRQIERELKPRTSSLSR